MLLLELKTQPEVDTQLEVEAVAAAGEGDAYQLA